MFGQGLWLPHAFSLIYFKNQALSYLELTSTSCSGGPGAAEGHPLLQGLFACPLRPSKSCFL